MARTDARNGAAPAEPPRHEPVPALRIHELKIEPLTPERFNPFGKLLDAKERPVDRRVLAYDKEVVVAGAATIGVIWEPYSSLTFTQLERHFNVTQAFVPMHGPHSVMAVAAPTDPKNPQDFPEPSQVRAFLIDGTVGFRYHVGTWHSPCRFVLSPPGATFVIVNVEPNPTEIVDYAKALGVAFRFSL